ncbi:hypothetical protein TRFO_23912 [Tritrichomonas foetus]|uniref:Calcineurin-like phosphoesterase domain-containing protein n=1 Tax=Tritrichomonas foetus TaxID=1144522 RepID=A0A1J4KE53_9EUKA|nr:hypothetical protein TRFO_23912 [Tritrichomonas foetus]|eukprot:OHT07741.1 hypothetical protein TRFO_23912 [Tritrichomonas foetus]
MKDNFFLLQYSWIFVLGIISLCLLPIGIPQNTGEFHSLKKFIPLNPPFVFLLISDLHLSSIRTSSYPTLKKYLNLSKNLYHPELFIFTGDLTDNYVPTDKIRPYHMQYAGDWKLYNKMMTELEIYPGENNNSIQVIGNHDIFCLGSFISPNNFINNTIPYKDYDDFELSTQYFTKTFSQSEITKNEMTKNEIKSDCFIVKFIKINRYSFPTGPICFHQISFLTKKFKKRLIDELDGINDKIKSNMTILVSHTPVLRYNEVKDFENILKSHSDNARLFLSGHWHPTNGFFMHFGKRVFEIVAPPFFKVPKIGIITIDNDVTIFHMINLDNPERAFITHPSPNFQKSEHDAYSPSSGEIRAIAFTYDPDDLDFNTFHSDYNNKINKLNKLNLSISGDINGQLSCSPNDEIKDGVFLCKLPYSNMKDGVYTIQKVGDWSGNLTFTIGHTSPSIKEIPYITQPQNLWTFFFLISWCFMIFILYPFAQSYPTNTKKKSKMSKLKKHQNILTSNVIFNSFYLLRVRVHNLPKHFQLILIVSVFWSLFLPISLFETEGKLCIFLSLGNCFFNNGFEYRYHYMGAMYGVYFIYFHIIPIFIIVSGFLTFSQKNTYLFDWFWISIDLILFLIGLRGAFYQFSWLVDMFGMNFALMSPLMFWFPILIYVNLIDWLIKELKSLRTNLNNEDSNELSQSLLYNI